MAEYDERSSEDLSDEPSPYRLEEMRKKGQVAMSRELTSSVVFLACAIVLTVLSKGFTEQFMDFLKELFTHKLIQDYEINSSLKAVDYMTSVVKFSFYLLGPFFVAAVVFAIATSVAQTQGFIFSSEPIKFDLNHVNPISGLQKLASVENLFQGFKSIVKFSAICAVLYFSVLKDLTQVSGVSMMTTSQILTLTGSLISKICYSIAAVMLIISAGDFFFQWWNIRKQARVTKAEAKQEQKEREGDPQIKSRIRSIQREMARKRMMKSVPKADVIITNPTHIAIAILYEKDFLAPKIIAKGGDFLAERIKKIARENGIPVIENKPLARALYKTVKVGQYVPRSFYQAVAEVLAYVYRLRPKSVVSRAEQEQ